MVIAPFTLSLVELWVTIEMTMIKPWYDINHTRYGVERPSCIDFQLSFAD